MNSVRRPVVWIVDDALAVRKSLGALLKTADIDVRDYGSATEFLANFAPVAPACLVVDHHMPDMTGIDLLRHLRGKGIAIPVIVITGNGDTALKEEAVAAGAVTLLHKPVDGEELIVLIESIVLNRE